MIFTVRLKINTIKNQHKNKANFPTSLTTFLYENVKKVHVRSIVIVNLLLYVYVCYMKHEMA